MSGRIQESISKFKVVELNKSEYLKPLRLEFEINGFKKYWDYLQVHDSVSILIYNRTRKVVVLVKQFRPSNYVCQIPGIREGSEIDSDKYPVAQGYTIELCAGIVDKKLTVEEIAREEVLEECGYDVPTSRFKKIFSFRDVGITGQLSTIFYVEVEDKEKVSAGGGLHDHGEFIEVIEMTIPELKSYIDSTNFNSPKGFAVAALWFFSNFDTKESHIK